MAKKNSLKNQAVAEIVRELSDKGYELIVKAYNNANYDKNQTQNLHDSYGSAVFYNGKLYPNSKRYMTNRAVGGRYNTLSGEVEYGRAEVDKFFDNYIPIPKGFELVCVVAMFYGEIIAKGLQSNVGTKYRVISGIEDGMQDLKNKYKGNIKNISWGAKV